MKLLLVSDTWSPQANGLALMLSELVRELQRLGHGVEVIHPGLFARWRWPGASGPGWALWPGAALRERLQRSDADAIHLATEGPLGWAVRAWCLRQGRAFSTAMHTPWPQQLQRVLHLPQAWTQAVLRRFHAPALRVLRGLGTQEPGRWHSWAGGATHQVDWEAGIDLQAFAYSPEPRAYAPLGPLAHPVSLCLLSGPSAHAIDEFVALDLPGSKLVCGVESAPGAVGSHTGVHWLGQLPRVERARVYAAADVLVLPAAQAVPTRALLEAMACGLPLAATPGESAREALGDSDAGAMDLDLGEAWRQALKRPRQRARDRAQRFGWPQAARRFVDAIDPTARAAPGAVDSSVARLKAQSRKTVTQSSFAR